MEWPVLGLIRFLLAIIVADSHLAWFIRPDSKVLAIGNFSGLAAVLGFLLISGYSIAASYAKQQHGFYFRRALRIFPLYALAIVMAALGPLILQKMPINLSGDTFAPSGSGQLIGNLLLLQGFVVRPPATNPVLWTLSVEAFFYIVTPLIARSSQRSVLIVSGASAAVYGLARFLNLPFYTELLFGINVILFGWAWLLGFWIYHGKHNNNTLVIAYGIGVCAIAQNNSHLMFLWPVTWTIAILGVGFAQYVHYHKGLARACSLLGDISYPLYLFHLFAFELIFVFKLSTFGVLYLFGASIVAILLDFAFDRPVKRLICKSMDIPHMIVTKPT